MIETVEEAVKKLNEVKYRGRENWYVLFDNWIRSYVLVRGNLYDGWMVETPDAIQIARSYELEMEVARLTTASQGALDHAVDQATRIVELEKELTRERQQHKQTISTFEAALREEQGIQFDDGTVINVAKLNIKIGELEGRSSAWYTVYDLCKSLGKRSTLPSGLGQVLNFINGLYKAKASAEALDNSALVRKQHQKLIEIRKVLDR